MRLPVLTALVALALAAVPAAAAAERSVPRGWLGVIADGPLTDPATRSDGEWDLMAAQRRRVGADGLRLARSAQPAGGAADRLRAPRTRVVLRRPRARGCRCCRSCTARPAGRRPPGDAGLAAARHGGLRRLPDARWSRATGRTGSLWAEHPELAARADPRLADLERAEPHALLDRAQPFARRYVKLLRARARALRAADPGSRTILAGLPNESWIALRAIYKAGGRGAFDAVALHPYTGKPRNVVRLDRVRARARCAATATRRKPVWVTELSWPAAQGQDRRADRASRPPTRARRRGSATALKLLARRAQAAEDRARRTGTRGSRARARPSAFDWSGLRRAARRPLVVSAPSLACSGARRAARALAEPRCAGAATSSASTSRAVRVPGERRGAREAGRAQALALGGVAEQRRGRARANASPSGGASRAAPPRGLRQRGDVGGDHGRPARHRLEHRQAEALVEGRQRERLGARVEAGQQRVGHGPRQPQRVEPLPRAANCGRWPPATTTSTPLGASAAPPGRARARFLRAVWEATQST